VKQSARDKDIADLWKLQGTAQKRLQTIWDCTAKLVDDAQNRRVVISESRMDELLHQIDLSRKDSARIGKRLEKLHNLD